MNVPMGKSHMYSFMKVKLVNVKRRLILNLKRYMRQKRPIYAFNIFGNHLCPIIRCCLFLKDGEPYYI